MNEAMLEDRAPTELYAGLLSCGSGAGRWILGVGGVRAPRAGRPGGRGCDEGHAVFMS